MSTEYYEFNNEEKKYILNNYKNYTYKEMASKIGCTYRQVERFCRNNGLKKSHHIPHRSQRIFSEADDAYIIKNYNNMSNDEIGDHLGFTRQQIQGRAYHLNLHKRRKINSTYFEKIDTPLKAYFLGFIYADGYVIYNEERSNYEFGMELQSKDKYILEKLNYELGNQNIISHKQPKIIKMNNGKLIHSNHSDCLRVYSKELVTDLIDNGVVCNKSNNNTFPIVDECYFFDFLRGYIDGDGCYYKDNGHVYMHITCANLIPLKYIQNKLSTYDISTQIYKETEKKYRLMCTSAHEMNKLINKMYYNKSVTCLKRKYNVIKHYLSLSA